MAQSKRLCTRTCQPFVFNAFRADGALPLLLLADFAASLTPLLGTQWRAVVEPSLFTWHRRIRTDECLVDVTFAVMLLQERPLYSLRERDLDVEDADYCRCFQCFWQFSLNFTVNKMNMRD